MRPGAGPWVLVASAAVLLGLLWASPIRREKSLPRLAIMPSEIPADGYALATLQIAGGDAPKITLDNPHAATVEQVERTADGWRAQIRAGVLAGRVTIRVDGALATLQTVLQAGDAAGDGTPDFLRLDDPRDQAAFRHWFTFLAEAQYFQDAAARPAEIVDCAALIRYAYREALRAHAGNWAAEARLPVIPVFDSVAKYQYPYTPLGASLFRVRDSAFRQADLADGAFAQFADAQTLRELNTHFVSRELERAIAGDLLFYRREATFHSMIYLGESQLAKDGARYVVYHTGPNDDGPGEIRRLSLPELMNFPEPEWRPVASNRNFLGVYRWNILRETQ